MAQLGMVFTGFFDNLMVSKLGYVQLASAGICNSIYFLIAVLPMGVTLSFTTITSILRGKKREKTGSLLARDALIFTLIISFITLLIMMLAIYHFEWFGQTPEVEQYSKNYLGLLAASLPFMLFFFYVKSMADGYDYTRAGMIITLTALLINIFFNWVFIYGNLGFKAYGLNGAGYATIISRIYMAVGISILFLKHKSIPFGLQDIYIAFQRRKNYRFYAQIFRLGIPTGLQYFFEVAAFAIAAVLAGWLGAKELAAHQLAITLAALTYMFASGMAAGTSIKVASVYGAGNYREVRAYGKTGLAMGFGIMILFALVFFIFNQILAAMFSTDPEVIALGAKLLILAGIFQLSDGIQVISAGLLRGLEDVNIPSVVTLVAYWVFAIPLGYYLGFVLEMSVEGIWVGLAGGLTISATLLFYRFFYLLRKKHHEINLHHTAVL